MDQRKLDEDVLVVIASCLIILEFALREPAIF